MIPGLKSRSSVIERAFSPAPRAVRETSSRHTLRHETNPSNKQEFLMGESDRKVAIVTGGDRLRDIGRAAAVGFAKLGPPRGTINLSIQ